MGSKSDKKSSRKLLKTRRSQILFCCIGLLCSAIFVLMQFNFSALNFIPSEAGKKKLISDLEKLEKEQKELQDELSDHQKVRDIAESKFNGAWVVRTHGRPEVELRTLLQNAAKKLELNLTNVSTVRKSNFNKDLTLLEVDVNLTSDLETLARFWVEISKITPHLYWKKFECRMTYMFGMPAVYFNGTLRCVCDERPVNKERKHSRAGKKGDSK